MKKGGYKIIDFKDTNLTAAGVTIKGVYAAIEDNYRKAILISGIVIENVEMADCFVDLHISSGSYVGTLHNYTLTITAADKVSIAQIA